MKADVSIHKREMNLAAYIKTNGGELVAVDKATGFYHFATTVSESDWRVRHSNSCCIKVDSEMLSLKRMMM